MRIAVVGVLLLSAGLTGAPQLETPDPEGMAADVRNMELDSNDARREVLESRLEDSGVAFSRQTFSIEPRPNYPRTVGTNLVVTLGSEEGDIVVGAHFDAVRLADGSLSHGAVDNAASAVVLTRLAATLAASPPRHRTHIVFFDMEEIGLVGSRRFVETHDHGIDAALNLDVNAYGDSVFFGPAGSRGNEALRRTLKETCLAQDITCTEFGRFPSSDHISFQRAGIPSVTMSVLPLAEAHQLWLNMNSDTEGVLAPGFVPRVFRMIHTTNDTSEQVEPEAMELSYRLALALVRSLDR